MARAKTDGRAGSAPPTHLRVEHLIEPVGVTEPWPRLSWRLPVDVQAQLAYRIVAGEWDSGVVESSESLLIPYAGPELTSRQGVTWSVKVWTEAGESDWSTPSCWEMGLLHREDWVARWIEPTQAETHPTGSRPPVVLRRTFQLPEDLPRSARLHATAHGIYEAFLNGCRVGDQELTPGYTSYAKNLQVQTLDVASHLRPGANVLVVIVSDGWFRGQVGPFRQFDVYGQRLALLAQLEVDASHGRRVAVCTDARWHASTGSIRAADLMQGQSVDLNYEPSGLWSLDPVLSGWAPVELVDHDMSRLAASLAPPVRRVEELQVRRSTVIGPGRQVFDFGVNLHGWVRLSDLGPPGNKLVLTHGESLDDDGDVTLDHLTLDLDSEAGVRRRSWLPWDLTAMSHPLQRDQVVASGWGDTFEPRHTTHGFRYLRVEGHPEEIASKDVTAIVVHTDLRRTGWFECSDSKVNRLHEAAVWSFRDNACDIPTDCPQRERAGWTGDWQIFFPAAAFLYDVAGFTSKWLLDLAAEQRDDGALNHMVPNPLPDPASDIVPNPFPPGSAGWGDAAIIVPWEMYLAYADVRLLERQWASMVRWLDFATSQARYQRHPDRIARRATAAQHEPYLWDSGFHFGEWMEPGAVAIAPGNRDEGAVATAYLCRSATLMSHIAQVLDKVEDAERYADLADRVRWAWQQEYLGADGTLRPMTQATHVRALAFDLVPEQLRPTVAANLEALVRRADTHLTTGFLATPHLLPVLAEAGLVDLAYELLLQDTPPSWMAMIDRGATTVWETWNGLDGGEGARPSLNHYSKGAVITFFHRYIAGIRPLSSHPAYRHFRIEPMPGGNLTFADGRLDCPFGEIRSTWEVGPSGFLLGVRVPPGTTAEVVLPDGTEHFVGPGKSEFRSRLPRAEDQRRVLAR